MTVQPLDRQECPVFLSDNQPFTARQLEQVAAGEALEIAPGYWTKVRQSRAYLERLSKERRRIYGVTTGYGPLASTYVDSAASAALQRGLVYHLSSGTGPELPQRQVRAIMASRVIAVAQGHSAIRPEALQLVLDCLRCDIIPVVPALGTVGASGDLTPLAHITRALMGEGVVDHGGVRMEAEKALACQGLTPLAPEGKDALALVNGTSAMTGIAGLNSRRARRALTWSARFTALYAECLGGHSEAFQPGLASVRPHPGQKWAQSFLLEAIAGSHAMQPNVQPPPELPNAVGTGETRLDQPLPQDAYTIRCAPQHLGAVYDTLHFHDQTVERELNSVTDNPVFFPDEDAVLHGGNFFGQHIALAADALNNALVTLAVHSERRIARITDPTLNQGLPPFLRGNNNGLHSGFMGAQVTATALVAELRTHAQPASIQSIPTNANNQDVVTLGTVAARRCSETLDRLNELLSIEGMILAQACDMRGESGSRLSPQALSLCAEIRQTVSPLKDDRPLAEDIRALATWLDQPDQA